MLGEYVDCTLKGQEKNLGTWAVCKINMIVRNFKDSDIRKGDILGSPKHIINGELETFDRGYCCVSSIFSSNWWEAAEVDIKKKKKKKMTQKGKPYNPKYK